MPLPGIPNIDKWVRWSAISASADRSVGLIVALAATLLCLPFVNSVWLLADEGIWLHAAQRILRGEILYRDFFEFHPPLGFLIVSSWMSLFGTSLIAMRLLIVLVIAATAWFTFTCCRIMSGRAGLSALLTISWVAAGQGMWTQVNHHWLSSMFSMIALWGILSSRKHVGPLTAGIAASAATLVTTHRGALIVIAGFVSLLLQKCPQKILIYIIGGISLLMAIIGLLWAEEATVHAFDHVILYAIRSYSNIQAVPFGAFLTPQMMLIVLIFPITACLLVLGLLRSRYALLNRHHFWSLVFFAIAGFAGCFPRPDAVHITFSAVLALPLLATLLDSFLPKDSVTPVLRSVALLVCFVPTYPLLLAVREVATARTIESAAGPIVVVPKNGTVEVIERLKTLPSGDPIFFYPYNPVLPFLTGRRHPARLDLLVPEYSTPAQYRESCLEVMRGGQWLVIDEEIIRPSFYRMIFPAMRNPSPPEKQAFEAALRHGFDLEERYGNFSLLRRATASSGLCNQIAPPSKKSPPSPLSW